MGETRLDNIAILNMRKNIANELDLVDICKQFVFKDNRKVVFGQFEEIFFVDCVSLFRFTIYLAVS